MRPAIACEEVQYNQGIYSIIRYKIEKRKANFLSFVHNRS
jgi:hypothetical protein